METAQNCCPQRIYSQRMKTSSGGQVDGDQLVLGSLDVEALYPSIDIKLAGQIIRERIRNSKLRIDGIDWRWILEYLRLTMSPLDIVENKVAGILPRQLKKQG